MITKQAINRLLKSDIDVKLWNGCFNVVKVEAIYSNGKRYELRVRVTHPFLEWQCGKQECAELVYWKGCNGRGIDIPEELSGLAENMKLAGTMSDQEAADLSARNATALSKAMSELGL